VCVCVCVCTVYSGGGFDLAVCGRRHQSVRAYSRPACLSSVSRRQQFANQINGYVVTCCCRLLHTSPA